MWVQEQLSPCTRYLLAHGPEPHAVAPPLPRAQSRYLLAHGPEPHVVAPPLPRAQSRLVADRRLPLFVAVGAASSAAGFLRSGPCRRTCAPVRNTPPQRRRLRSSCMPTKASYADDMQASDGAHDEEGEDLFVRVFCASAEMVGDDGAIVGLMQLNDIEAPHHVLDVPVEFPILLDVEQTAAFRRTQEGQVDYFKTVGATLDSMALCEIRIHAEAVPGKDSELPGELVIAEECRLPKAVRDDGLIRLEDTVVTERCVPVPVGEALAIALRLSAPVLLSTRRLLSAAKACVDRLRLEQSFCAEDADAEGCDVELAMLSQDLREHCGPTLVPASRIGGLIKELKPFAWYWAERRRGGSPGSRTMAFADFRARFEHLRRAAQRRTVQDGQGAEA